MYVQRAVCTRIVCKCLCVHCVFGHACMCGCTVSIAQKSCTYVSFVWYLWRMVHAAHFMIQILSMDTYGRKGMHVWKIYIYIYTVRPEICNCIFPCGLLDLHASQIYLFARLQQLWYTQEKVTRTCRRQVKLCCAVYLNTPLLTLRVPARLFIWFFEPKTEPTIRPKNGPLKPNCVSGAKFLVPYFGAAFKPRMWADIAQTYEQGQQKIGSRNAAKLVARARSDKSSLKLFWRFRMLLLKYIAACHCMQLSWSTSQHIYATGTRTHSIYIYIYRSNIIDTFTDVQLPIFCVCQACSAI